MVYKYACSAVERFRNFHGCSFEHLCEGNLWGKAEKIGAQANWWVVDVCTDLYQLGRRGRHALSLYGGFFKSHVLGWSIIVPGSIYTFLKGQHFLRKGQRFKHDEKIRASLTHWLSWGWGIEEWTFVKIIWSSGGTVKITGL